MARKYEAAPTYEAAQLFKERCLRAGTSFLWPERSAWTRENLDRLAVIFSHPAIERDRKLQMQWKERLRAESEELHRVAADLLAFYYLFPANASAEKKFQTLDRMIHWRLSDDVPDLAFLTRAYAAPVAPAGVTYSTSMNEQILFFLRFAQAVRNEKSALGAPSLAKTLADATKKLKARTSGRHALLHLLFPDQFEPITSEACKKKIVRAFRGNAGSLGDLDDALYNIRHGLAEAYGLGFDFFRADLRTIWDKPSVAERSSVSQKAINVPGIPMPPPAFPAVPLARWAEKRIVFAKDRNP